MKAKGLENVSYAELKFDYQSNLVGRALRLAEELERNYLDINETPWPGTEMDELKKLLKEYDIPVLTISYIGTFLMDTMAELQEIGYEPCEIIPVRDDYVGLVSLWHNAIAMRKRHL